MTEFENLDEFALRIVREVRKFIDAVEAKLDKELQDARAAQGE